MWVTPAGKRGRAVCGIAGLRAKGIKRIPEKIGPTIQNRCHLKFTPVMELQLESATSNVLIINVLQIVVLQ